MTTTFRYRDSKQAAKAIHRIADHNGLVVEIKTAQEAAEAAAEAVASQGEGNDDNA